jgi:hypothetical protein
MDEYLLSNGLFVLYEVWQVNWLDFHKKYVPPGEKNKQVVE